MRRITVFGGLSVGLVLLLVAFQIANAQEGESLSQVAHEAMITDYTGPETCATCHPAAAQEVVDSLHYQQQGPVPYRVGWPEGELGGMYVTY